MDAYKVCSKCEHIYTREEWSELPYVGEMADEFARIELRNCIHCPGTPSTLAIEEPASPKARAA